MKFLTVLCLTFFSLQAFAQLTEQEKEGDNTLRVLGRSFYPSFYSLASIENDKFSEEGGRLGTYNYFSFSTFVKGDYRFIFRAPFTYGSAGTDRFGGSRNNGQELKVQDPVLEIRNPELAFIPWDIGLWWTARVYVPISEHSRNIGQIARFRNQLSFSKMATNRIQLVYDQRSFYYWQSRTAYRAQFEDEYGFPVDTVSLTRKMTFQHWMSAWWKIGRESGFGWSLKYEDNYWNKSTAERKSKPAERLIATGPQARFPFSDSVSFIVSYEDSVDRDNNYAEFGKFLSKNTQVVLHSFVSF